MPWEELGIEMNIRTFLLTKYVPTALTASTSMTRHHTGDTKNDIGFPRHGATSI